MDDGEDVPKTFFCQYLWINFFILLPRVDSIEKESR